MLSLLVCPKVITLSGFYCKRREKQIESDRDREKVKNVKERKRGNERERDKQ
jgi:hypothetical protein